MSLDMLGFIDTQFESTPDGDVKLITPAGGGYTGPGGTWEDGTPTEVPLTLVNIQPVDNKTAEFFQGQGGTVNPTDMRKLYINDGTMIYPDDNGQHAQILKFSDGLAVRQWRVRQADNRPWRNYCKVIVERYRAGESD